MNNVLLRLTTALADRYRVDRELGAGGMATVYLAHDIKHQRDVAIKVLHPDLGAALGGERFLSEIRTTARLQHPHILPLLDSGEADGLLYYVMPLVTGETLRARLEREKQLPIDDAILIAREVADALGYAHGLGVIHRDIKPENILLQNGHALVADFGIALAVQQAGGARMTQTGLSLGTPQYMSPEQAMGERTLDARSDVYALGAVSYEMLAGEAPFTGPTVQAIVARLIAEEPRGVTAQRKAVPDVVDAAVLRALEKLPSDRFQTAGDFAAALDGRGSAAATRLRPGARATARGPMVALGALALGATVLAAWGWLRGPSQSDAPVTRVAIAWPRGEEIRPYVFGNSVALSRDGRVLAYTGPGPRPGTSQIWLRPLDTLRGTPLPGSVGATSAEWSPDGESFIIFRGDVDAAIVRRVGGEVASLRGFEAPTFAADGSVWGVQGSHLLHRQLDGRVDTVRLADSTSRISRLALFPDGKGALAIRVQNDPTVVDVDFETGRFVDVMRGEYARVLGDGTVWYATAVGDIYHAEYDRGAHRIGAGPRLLARAAIVRVGNGGRAIPQFTLADDGTSVHLVGALNLQRLAWLDAQGRVTGHLGGEQNLVGFALSPDGSRLVTAEGDFSLSESPAQIWVTRLADGVRTAITRSNLNMRPSWAPDGRSVVWTRVGDGPGAIYERPADASGPERLVVSPGVGLTSTAEGRWMPDGRSLLIRTWGNIGVSGGMNVYRVDPRASVSPIAVLTGAADELAAVPSPDGSLVAFLSDTTGRLELYVQRFDDATKRLQLTTTGGSPARWSRNGRRLSWFSADGKLVTATLATTPALAVTGIEQVTPEVVPETTQRSHAGFDIAADGRVLVAEELRATFETVLVRNALGTRAMRR